MAKPRQARFTTEEIARMPEVDDESSMLWDAELSEVARGLLTSAVRCFASNGYHATTTRDISTAAGLSPAALYVHFASKELILYEIIRTGHQRVLDRVTEISAAEFADAAAFLHAMVARYTEWHARYHVTARVSQFELAGLTAEHYETILGIRHRTNAVFRDAVASGVDDGTFADVDVFRVTRAMLSLCIDLARWYRLEGKDSPELLGQLNADLALRMVTSAS